MPGPAYSRERFELIRTAAKAAERRDSLVLAVISVTLGLAQLGFIKWADANLPRRTAVPWEGGFFLAYAALVGGLIWRMQRRRRAGSPPCPQCGAPLTGMSERVATATGRCDRCGGLVIEPASAA